MDKVLNPYSPGAGRAPAALVGRDQQLESWDVRLRRIEAGRDAEAAAFFGLRGVGKTVLLHELATRAQKRGWITAKVEADSGATNTFRHALGEALHDPLTDLARPSAGIKILRALKTALSFKASYDSGGTWNFGIDLSEVGAGGADTGTLSTDVTRLIKDVCHASEKGLAVLIDEAQDLSDDEMKVVASVAHQASQERWPVVFAIAGLPSLPRLLAEAKSYTERLFPFTYLGGLNDELAQKVLTIPAAHEQVNWEEEALHIVTDASRGYPFFLQEFGQATWNVAYGNTITIEDAKLGVATGMNRLDNGFFRTRWERTTPAEKSYLRAMAENIEEGVQVSDIAARMNRSVNSLSPLRSNLINKGIIFSSAHGIVDFTVPRMADFIHRCGSE